MLLINEIQRAEELLNGKSFTKEYFFSAYCVLIKYFIGKGLQPNEIRNNILDWENKFGYKRYFDLNDVVVKLYDDKVSAKGDYRVNISEQDIKEITTRFDKINERKIAFAMLCYAKINADKNGCFYMSFLELSNWINVDKSNISLNIPLPKAFEDDTKVSASGTNDKSSSIDLLESTIGRICNK